MNKPATSTELKISPDLLVQLGEHHVQLVFQPCRTCHNCGAALDSCFGVTLTPGYVNQLATVLTGWKQAQDLLTDVRNLGELP